MAINSKSEKIVDRLVESGRFASRDAVLHAAIAEGLADAKAGRVFTVEEVRAQLLKEFSQK